MSGQQIGTVVGGVIGAFWGPAGAQLGMAIGGLIGGAVDPTRINGPKIGDGQQQTATDGAPIAWVQGTAMVAGTIVQVSKRRQIRHKDNGKGGPVVTTYTAVQDFAILICESCELRDSTMSSVLMVMQDGKLVYDVRPGSTMLADSYKWKANVDFMFGAEDQLPHPTLEAITGVGNTPVYRGSLVAVFKNFDVSAAGDRIPTFHFVVSQGASDIKYTDAWRYKAVPPTGYAEDYSSPSYDDAGWAVGQGGFGSADAGIVIPHVVGTTVPRGVKASVWLRRYLGPAQAAPTVTMFHDDAVYVWFNGELIYQNTNANNSSVPDVVSLPIQRGGLLAVKVVDSYPAGSPTQIFAGIGIEYNDQSVSLGGIVRRICLRGGLTEADIDHLVLDSTLVSGYPIARQATAADCLLPLLQAYFGYATEYDAQLHFRFYGADASVVVDRADLIEGNDSNKGAIVSNLRNQSTEFPRRIVGSYMDPAQNYTVVDVAAERRAVDVLAIGDQSFQIPVVMEANDAAQAAQKALKVAYATLEGTLEYSTPFAGADVYLSLAAGEPLQLLGKRYVADELILGNGSIKLTTRYDRQSAYTSNVQAILGNAPVPPSSPYSGPTTLIPMNLPAQRPQDTVGVYLAAGSSTGSPDWLGCTVQASFDGMATWQNVASIKTGSIFGSMAAVEPYGGEPLTVDLVSGDLSNATAAQLAAGANAWATSTPGTGRAQLGQFATATEDSLVANRYALTGVTRSVGGVAQFPVTTADRFTMMDAAYFLPIDPSFAGRVLYFRAIGLGELESNAVIETITYLALQKTPGDTRVTEDGVARIAENGIDIRLTE